MANARLEATNLLSDSSISAAGAGLLAVFVSYAGPLLIYLSAAEAMGASTAAFGSWVFAISMSAGLTSIGLSIWFRVPVAMAWSAPGTVLLIALGASISMQEVVGAYLIVAAALIVIGLSGAFQRLVQMLPSAITNGMMAGILFGFGMKAASGLATEPFIVALLIAAFAICTVLVPRYAVVILLGLAFVLVALSQNTALSSLDLALADPLLVRPEFSMEATLGLALPLLITTLSGQYLPGMSILSANGYTMSANPVLIVGGLASAASALFGGITTALASITASFCAGSNSHPDPDRRYVAGVACGVVFCIGGLFSGTIVNALVLLPSAVIALLAGLALLQPILKFTTDMLASEGAQSGLLTFLITASGLSLLGIGAAFWGVVIGVGFYLLTGLTQKLLHDRSEGAGR